MSTRLKRAYLLCRNFAKNVILNGAKRSEESAFLQRIEIPRSFDFAQDSCDRNDNIKFAKNRAFSLVELMIITALLGILAAMVLPSFQGHVTEAKEAAAKENLRLLRHAIELYAAQHNDNPPGTLNGNTLPYYFLRLQLTSKTNENGANGTDFGPYLSDMPENPFNNKKEIRTLGDGDFPTEATGDYGWIYQSSTKTIRLDWPGTDSKGVRYYDY